MPKNENNHARTAARQALQNAMNMADKEVFDLSKHIDMAYMLDSIELVLKNEINLRMRANLLKLAATYTE